MSQTKKSWQMTTEEFYQFTKKNLTHPMTQRPYKKIPDWFTKERQLNIHYQIVRDALAEGEPIPAKVLKKYPDLVPIPLPKGGRGVVPEKVAKAPWQMTRKEYAKWTADEAEKRALETEKRIENKELPVSLREDVNRQRGLAKQLRKGEWTPEVENYRKRQIQQALSEGKAVPTKVLKDYPELLNLLSRKKVRVGEKKMRKARPLPEKAENITDLTFNTTEFQCYGKPIKRGYRVYCRRKSLT